MIKMMMKVLKFIQLQHILITVREHSQRRLVCIPSQMVFLILIHLRMMMLRRTGRRRGCWLMEWSRMLMSWRVSAETIFWCQSRLLATLLCSPVMGNIYWIWIWIDFYWPPVIWRWCRWKKSPTLKKYCILRHLLSLIVSDPENSLEIMLWLSHCWDISSFFFSASCSCDTSGSFTQSWSWNTTLWLELVVTRLILTLSGLRYYDVLIRE